MTSRPRNMTSDTPLPTRSDVVASYLPRLPGVHGGEPLRRVSRNALERHYALSATRCT
jgi:hypothetical protein